MKFSIYVLFILGMLVHIENTIYYYISFDFVLHCVDKSVHVYIVQVEIMNYRELFDVFTSVWTIFYDELTYSPLF